MGQGRFDFDNAPNQFGLDEESEWSPRGRYTKKDNEAAQRAEHIEGLLRQFSDRDFAFTLTSAEIKEGKIVSICDQHWAGRQLSSKQRWCLAACCYDNHIGVKHEN